MALDIIPAGANFNLVDDRGNVIGTFPSKDAALKQQLLMEYQGVQNVNPQTATAFQGPTIPSLSQPGIVPTAAAPVSAARPVVMPPQQQVFVPTVTPDEHAARMARLKAQYTLPENSQTALSGIDPNAPPQPAASPWGLNFAVSAPREQELDLAREKGRLEAARMGQIDPNQMKGAFAPRDSHMEHFPTPAQADILHMNPAEMRAHIKDARAARAMGLQPKAIAVAEEAQPQGEMSAEQADAVMRKIGAGPPMDITGASWEDDATRKAASINYKSKEEK